MQAASTLATAHYPETLGRTYVSTLISSSLLLLLFLIISLAMASEISWEISCVNQREQIIGAPSFFPTIWSWIKTWFDQNTVSKIVIVPAGKELSTLSESYDPIDIPRKYGGQFDFDFGMPPDFDPEIRDAITWLPSESGKSYVELPIGPMRWVNCEDGKRTAVAVGKVDGEKRRVEVLALKR